MDDSVRKLEAHHDAETHQMDGLLESNTALTQQVHGLAQKIHDLTEQIAKRTPSAEPNTEALHLWDSLVAESISCSSRLDTQIPSVQTMAKGMFTGISVPVDSGKIRMDPSKSAVLPRGLISDSVAQSSGALFRNYQM